MDDCKYVVLVLCVVFSSVMKSDMASQRCIIPRFAGFLEDALNFVNRDKPGAISQGRRGPAEKVCRRQPGEGVWERVICLIQNTVGGPESSARGSTHPAQSLLKDLKER